MAVFGNSFLLLMEKFDNAEIIIRIGTRKEIC